MKKNAPGGQGKALSDGGVLCLLCKKIYNLSVVLEIKTRYNKKPIKTVKTSVKHLDKTVKLPKKKGMYYVKVSKRTKKTNGYYEIKK